MKTIHDYHQSDIAVLNDIKNTLYKAPLSNSNGFLATTTLYKTILEHLENLKSEYGVPYLRVSNQQSSAPLSIYSNVWKITDIYKKETIKQEISPYPFLVLEWPEFNKEFDYLTISSTLNKEDPFIEPGKIKNNWEKEVEQYNLYNATSLPISFVAKCNIIIVSDVDLTKKAPMKKTETIPSFDYVDMTGDIPYWSMNALYNEMSNIWLRPEYKDELSKNISDINDSYSNVFETPEGRNVLSDLERVANLTKIDANNPNSGAAIYKLAQLSLVQRIKNQLLIKE
jgi:hypothetical protein